MSNLDKGQNAVKSCLGNVKKRARVPCFDAFPPTLRTYQRRGMQYPDLIWKELTAIMTHPVADSGVFVPQKWEQIGTKKEN